MAGTTRIAIYNRALQLCGSHSISSISDNSPAARACNVAYQSVLHQELRSNFWNFSIKRASLPASTTKPDFGPGNYFPLPPDYLEIAPPDQYVNYSFGVSASQSGSSSLFYRDWKIEQMPDGSGPAIVSNEPAPLYIRYVSMDILEGSFDPSFAEMLACSLAISICEQLTQSSTKLAQIEQIYLKIKKSAKQRNSFESRPVQAPVDSYIVARM